MDKKKKPVMLITGAVLTLAGLAASIYGLTNYVVNEEKINSADPMFPVICVGLFAFMTGAVLLVKALLDLRDKEPVTYTKKEQLTTMAQAGLFAALAYVLFVFLKIPLGSGNTSLHLGNTMVVLAALLIGGSWGGLAGAVGLTLADFTSGYTTSAPKTFFLKLLIGLITGLLAHKVFKITRTTDNKKVVAGTIVSAVAGLLFNCVADPVVGYFYKQYLFGYPQDVAKALAKVSSLATAVNAVLSGIIAVVLYLALRPALKKVGLFKSL